jgi:hypothetical protein
MFRSRETRVNASEAYASPGETLPLRRLAVGANEFGAFLMEHNILEACAEHVVCANDLAQVPRRGCSRTLAEKVVEAVVDIGFLLEI